VLAQMPMAPEAPVRPAIAGPHLLDELVRMCQAYVAGHPLEDPRVSPRPRPSPRQI